MKNTESGVEIENLAPRLHKINERISNQAESNHSMATGATKKVLIFFIVVVTQINDDWIGLDWKHFYYQKKKKIEKSIKSKWEKNRT